MISDISTTFRLVDLEERQFGQTALTPELAKLSLGEFGRANKLGLERTDWDNQNGRPKPVRTILIEAENTAGEWVTSN